METKNWKPDSVTRKMLQEYSTCCYLYKDGVVVLEKHKTKITKDTYVENEIAHVWYYNTSLEYANNYDKTQEKLIPLRLVIHQSDLLLDGLQHVHVSYHNTSDSMRAEGRDCTSITLKTISGVNIHVHNFHGFASGITVQPDPTDNFTSYNMSDTVDSWTTDQYVTVVRHNSKEANKIAA